jgi:hypothetical protein
VTDPLIVNFGGGVNSTALLVGFHERSIRPDAILFADTGDEHPHTYEHLTECQTWLERVGFPSIEVVKRQTGLYSSLEEECLSNRTLPSLAFGFRGCSAKWKRQVVDRVVKRRYGTLKGRITILPPGFHARRALGIDYGELHRAKFQAEGPWLWEYPLIDWKWARAECVEAIARVGMTPPGKSACFYCPASKKSEVIRLSEEEPELFARALAMEENAQPNLRGGSKTVGLGRHWKWSEVVDAHRRALPVVEDPTKDTPCDCFDGTA